MSVYKEIYASMVSDAKRQGYKVYHGKRKKNLAMFNSVDKWIHICSTLKNKRYGCFILGHELGHINDLKNDKFPSYFKSEKYLTKPLPVSYIRKIEQSANNYSRKRMLEFGVDVSDLDEFDLEKFENYPHFMPWWIEFYNYIRIGRKFDAPLI